MKFKKGDVIVCESTYAELRLAGMSRLLTEGKSYEVLSVKDSYVWVVNDEYVSNPFWAERFSLYRRTIDPKNRSRVDAGPSWGLR